MLGYIGTYTRGAGGRAEGIYSFSFDDETGRVKDLHIAAESINPEYLVLSRSKEYLYATNETNDFGGSPSGAVSAFTVHNDSFTLINQMPSLGKSPCHITLSSDETRAVVSNYLGGVSVLDINKDHSIGKVIQILEWQGNGPNKDRQGSSHPHSFMFDKHNDYGLVCDLGCDKIRVFSFDKDAFNNPLTPVNSYFTSKPGAGPRHSVFHPNGETVYAVNELDSTIDVIKYKDGHLELLQTLSALPPQATAPQSNIAAAIKFGADARFLYVSNRGDDNITIFGVKESGFLEYLKTFSSDGKTPRDFAVTNNFLLVCHQDSDNLVVFRINRFDGSLEKTAEYEVLSGVCITMAI
jgi:6-phosphogluconolactonase